MPRILFTASGDNKNQLGVKKEKEEGESEGKKFDTPKKKKKEPAWPVGHTAVIYKKDTSVERNHMEDEKKKSDARRGQKEKARSRII